MPPKGQDPGHVQGHVTSTAATSKGRAAAVRVTDRRNATASGQRLNLNGRNRIENSMIGKRWFFYN